MWCISYLFAIMYHNVQTFNKAALTKIDEYVALFTSCYFDMELIFLGVIRINTI